MKFLNIIFIGVFGKDLFSFKKFSMCIKRQSSRRGLKSDHHILLSFLNSLPTNVGSSPLTLKDMF